MVFDLRFNLSPSADDFTAKVVLLCLTGRKEEDFEGWYCSMRCVKKLVGMYGEGATR